MKKVKPVIDVMAATSNFSVIGQDAQRIEALLCECRRTLLLPAYFDMEAAKCVDSYRGEVKTFRAAVEICARYANLTSAGEYSMPTGQMDDEFEERNFRPAKLHRVNLDNRKTK